MQFPCSYFLRSSLLSGHFVEIEFLCCGVIMGISGRTGSFLTASLLKRHKRVFDTRYMDWTTNPDSSSWWFNALCCLSFARQSRNENMVWISSAFLADRIGDGHIYFTSVVWFYRLFCTLFLYLGWLSVFFFSCHLSRSCWWCLHAGFVDRRFLIISFPFIICEEKEAVSFLNISFYLLTLRVVFMFVVFHVLDIKPGRLSDHLSVLFWFYVVDAFPLLFLHCIRRVTFTWFDVFPSPCEFTRFSIGWLALSFLALNLNCNEHYMAFRSGD